MISHRKGARSSAAMWVNTMRFNLAYIKSAHTRVGVVNKF